MPYQVCTNDESGLTLTFLIARLSLILNAFIWEKSLNFHVFYDCLSGNHNIYTHI